MFYHLTAKVFIFIRNKHFSFFNAYCLWENTFYFLVLFYAKQSIFFNLGIDNQLVQSTSSVVTDLPPPDDQIGVALPQVSTIHGQWGQNLIKKIDKGPPFFFWQLTPWLRARAFFIYHGPLLIVFRFLFFFLLYNFNRFLRYISYFCLLIRHRCPPCAVHFCSA